MSSNDGQEPSSLFAVLRSGQGQGLWDPFDLRCRRMTDRNLLRFSPSFDLSEARVMGSLRPSMPSTDRQERSFAVFAVLRFFVDQIGQRKLLQVLPQVH